jgi:drug/metabolite transporter (DMT)-like permease
MSGTLATVFLGLAASLFWGSGDFCGGLASRRSQAASVVACAYMVGFLLLLALAFLWREPFPPLPEIGWAALAGLSGAIGLVSFYQALSIGSMGIAAPTSAVLSAGLPVLFSAFTEGLPYPLQIGGFLLALIAILLISRPEKTQERPKGIWLALLAGCGFGGFFILISRGGHTETFWPLAIARLVSVLFLLLLARIRQQPVRLEKKVALLVLMAGILDAMGNAFFVLAAHSGRLDIASILSSLYPAATILLAALFLRERVTRIQGVGILLALVAIAMISS